MVTVDLKHQQEDANSVAKGQQQKLFSVSVDEEGDSHGVEEEQGKVKTIKTTGLQVKFKKSSNASSIGKSEGVIEDEEIEITTERSGKKRRDKSRESSSKKPKKPPDAMGLESGERLIPVVKEVAPSKQQEQGNLKSEQITKSKNQKHAEGLLASVVGAGQDLFKGLKAAVKNATVHEKSKDDSKSAAAKMQQQTELAENESLIETPKWPEWGLEDEQPSLSGEALKDELSTRSGH